MLRNNNHHPPQPTTNSRFHRPIRRKTLLFTTLLAMIDPSPHFNFLSAFTTPSLFTAITKQQSATIFAMAVDRSKFRTCEQTSFCRRHRYSGFTANTGEEDDTIGNDEQQQQQQNKDDEILEGEQPSSLSSSLYRYRIVPESIIINLRDDGNIDNNSKDNIDNVINVGKGSGGGVASLMKHYLGRGVPSNDISDGIDPNFRGPSPVLTANIVNDADGIVNENENAPLLKLSLHLHEDGVARVRIVEEKRAARWTSDEMVLNEDEMVSALSATGDGVEILSAPKGIIVVDEDSKADGEDGGNGVDPPVSAKIERIDENRVVLGYGKHSQQQQQQQQHEEEQRLSIVEINLNPFVINLRRGDDEDLSGIPLVAYNTDGMMHFEIRQNKGEEQHDPVEEIEEHHEEDREEEHYDGEEHFDDGEEHFEEEENDVDNNGKMNDDDRHGGKEIVGYWEDGLAIYADGTREQPSSSTDEIESEILDDNAKESRRVLTEASEEAISQKENRDRRTLRDKDKWEESFGPHADTKPYGPMSVGGDVSFPSSDHLYGLPEHASSLRLQGTVGRDGIDQYKEPYRLYNLDVFEYELNETMALYGEVPLIVSQSVRGDGDVGTGTTSGAFWFNPTETFVDVIPHDDSFATNNNNKKTPTTTTHWISESGIVDLFLLPGPNPQALYGQYARLTGRAPTPPMFSLGYHQCRWNYRDERDVQDVHAKFEELDYPYDVLWLDIEHTDGKRYFTWDKGAFPDPIGMQNRLAAQGRKMVTIVDPHILRDNNYYVHKEATKLGLYVKDKSGGKDFDGWCWPGSSSYLDFTDSNVRAWWAGLFSYERYKGSTPSLFTWNDMNEPSVFNGPEVSMSKDLKNKAGVEHREWHNLYGMLFQRATAEGLVKRNEGKNVVDRPFVLSRSFFAGSQRYGAIWTGDNESTWDHLKAAAPMLLSLNVAALSFVGADVGGFFGDPDAELMTRWMQAGAYTPFFRGHAHHDSKRREPWMFGNSWMVLMRTAAAERYALLPYWYGTFREAEVTGMPVMRAMWMQYPEIKELYNTDDQYLIGSDLLVKPITSSGVDKSDVIFPTRDIWYDVRTMSKMPVVTEATQNLPVAILSVESDIQVGVPVYQRGGSIIPRRLRLRRSTATMTHDPYTLYVALDHNHEARGGLYTDDEVTSENDRSDSYANAVISCSMKCNSSGSSSLPLISNVVKVGDGWADGAWKHNRMIERIVIMGLECPPTSMEVMSEDGTRGRLLDMHYDTQTKILVIRKPYLSAIDNWEIRQWL